VPGARTFAAGRFALELDGKPVGPLKSVSGGDGFADVVAEPAKTYFSKKHVANVRWTPFRVSVAPGMGKALGGWISTTLTGGAARKDGAVLELDAAGAVKARRAFTGALLTEVTLPACDAAAKEAGFFTLELTPEQVRTEKASGKAGTGGTKQKAWTTGNFELKIDGLDATKVSSIAALPVRQSVAAQPAGGARRTRAAATSLEFPNLVVTLAAAGAQTWSDWFDDFVLKGNNADANERNGTLRLLTADRKDAIGEARFFNLGICRLTTEPAQGDALRRVFAELYCERMEIDIA
jgi:hypothetical protein